MNGFRKRASKLAIGFDRWSQIVRRHKPEQLARRLWNRVRDRAGIADWHGSTDLFAEPPPRRPLTVAVQGTNSGTVRLATQLAAGMLDVLNCTVAVGRPFAWDKLPDLRLSALATFQLQYHEFLLDIFPVDPTLAEEVLAGWLDQFAFPTRDPSSRTAWHPYCISRRIFVWMDLLQQEPITRLSERLIDGLSRQARRLSRRFERDLGGNHLWDNARALTAAGCFFTGAEAAGWRKQGWQTLTQCFEEQILSWGEHDERSPMYQLDMLRGLRQLAGWLAPVDESAAEICLRNATRMEQFLNAIRHPDGGLPLLGDSTLDRDEPHPPQGFTTAWVGDYYVHRTADRHALLFDAGDLGPEHLPAHTHADLLGAEISVFGRRLLVDSGVYEYSGPNRQAFRQSSAHNVLMVDGKELADVWGDFRMGDRGRVVARRSGVSGQAIWAAAQHNAYRRMGVRIQRYFIADPNGPWWSIHLVDGPGSHEAVEHLHWSPEIQWEVQEAGTARTTIEGRRVYWHHVQPTVWGRDQGRYSDRFSIQQPNDHWTLTVKGTLPIASAWALSFDDDLQAIGVFRDAERLVLNWRQRGEERAVVVPTA